MNAGFPGKPKASAKTLLARTHESLIRSQAVHDFAKKLRAAGLRTGIFSNVAELLAEPHFRLGDYDAFDPLFLSYRDKMAKPDIKYYEFALKTLDLPGAEVLFIDDKERNLLPARTLGMQTILFQTPDQNKHDIVKILRIENGIMLDG